MIKKLIISILLVNAYGCTTKGMEPRSVESYYQSAGTEKYFLSDIPDWINISETANCKRNKPIRFFNLKQLMNSFDIDFKKALQIQATYNLDYLILSNKLNGAPIPLADEQNLFYKASDKVNSNIMFFEAPKFKRINLVWVDSIINNPEEEIRLKKFLISNVFDQAVPVLISMCMTRSELEEKFNEIHYNTIPAELLTLYGPEGSVNNQFKFYFDHLFSSDHILNLYTKDKTTAEKIFNGKLKLFNY